jgi:peroxiredoxin
MTDWQRVEKLRAKGLSWDEVARDRRVGFHPPKGTDPGRALKIIFRRHGSNGGHEPRRDPLVVGTTRRLTGSRQKIVLVAILVVAVLLAVYVVEFGPNLNQKPTGWVGRVAPDFSLSIANGGGQFTLSSEQGQKNVLLFFNEGLSCSPCLGQMQQLDSDAAQFQGLNVQIVSITGDSYSEMQTWAQQSGVTHTMVLADPTLSVSNAYDTTGAAVSMMPGSAPGHTFILVNETGIVVWRADYGPSDMSVPDSQILQAVQSALHH